MSRNGYNVLACLAIVAAVVVNIATGDKDLPAALVVLAGTVVGRGDKAA
jgi:hypothetical protein